LNCGHYSTASPLTEDSAFAGSFEDCLEVCYNDISCYAINYSFDNNGPGLSICQALPTGGSIGASGEWDSASFVNR
jgi:hypothetical protein